VVGKGDTSRDVTARGGKSMVTEKGNCTGTTASVTTAVITTRGEDDNDGVTKLDAAYRDTDFEFFSGARSQELDTSVLTRSSSAARRCSPFLGEPSRNRVSANY
jgi:hypothetical protein